MYTLYDGHATGGVTVRAALAEIGAPHKIVNVDLGAGEQRSEDFSRINPCQQVPVLVLPDGTILSENIAILMYLADAHTESELAPRCGTVERAQVNRWLSFFAMNIYGPEYLRMRPAFYTTDPTGADGIAAAAAAYLKRHYGIFEAALGGGPYLLNARFSIVDIYIWMLVQWWDDRDQMYRDWPKTTRLVDTVMRRPKIALVHEAHFGKVISGETGHAH